MSHPSLLCVEQPVPFAKSAPKTIFAFAGADSTIGTGVGVIGELDTDGTGAELVLLVVA